ncbi:30S ribosomal protein S15 [Blattabacterium cuenoti]|uniref:30S ribosomal protein S15 n=1 Tax=Blattabacterium cuenoti TaxID=1653831 RepID=UPI00163BBD82|nr:30S ribosomal protein S15 [Blattabacterium cuenoti]
MSLTVNKKQNIFKTYGKSMIDTGSSQSQIALFTYRINHLSNHLKKNKKDFNTERSLVKLVVKRKKLLKYLKKNNLDSYKQLIVLLGLRK